MLGLLKIAKVRELHKPIFAFLAKYFIINCVLIYLKQKLKNWPKFLFRTGFLRKLSGRGLLILIILAIYILTLIGQENIETDNRQVLGVSAANGQIGSVPQSLEQEKLPELGELPISAKAALVYNLDAEAVVFGKNAQGRLGIASLTKLTTAILVSRNLSPDKVITVSANAIQELPQPVIGLQSGERIRVSALVEAMLVASANDAAQVLAEAVSEQSGRAAAAAMNELATELGLRQTSYANAVGFDSLQAYSSAYDVLRVVFEIRRTPWLRNLLSESGGFVSSENGKLKHYFKTTNKLLSTGYVTGGKTGYTEGARGNLVVFAKNSFGDELVVMVLGSENRERDISLLLAKFAKSQK